MARATRYFIGADEGEVVSGLYHGDRSWDTYGEAAACFATYPDDMKWHVRIYRVVIEAVGHEPHEDTNA